MSRSSRENNPNRRRKAICGGCGRRKAIESIRKQLCAFCVGEATIEARFDKLCAKFDSFTGAKREIMDALIEYERGQPLTQHAWMRVWGLWTTLARVPHVRRLRNWVDVETLRGQIKADPAPARRHKAHWALHKVCLVLLERGTLDPRPPKTTGPLPEQLETIEAYFLVEDPYRSKLLRTLVEYFQRSRVTITAVHTTQALAFFLSRNAVETIKSWDDIHGLIRNAPGPSERWHSRIKTALRRLGDALEQQGTIPPHPDGDSLGLMLEKIALPNGPARTSLILFTQSMFEHGRRPSTLRGYILTLGRFWSWAFEHGVTHPTHVSREVVTNFVRYLRNRKWSADRIREMKGQIRRYFEWLRRERMVLTVPFVVESSIPTRPIVRVCTKEDFARIVGALDGGRLAPREALVIYLLCFHGLRTYEIVELRALGFRSVRANETFDLELSPAVISAGSFRATRSDRVLHLPTGRYPWLRRIVTEVVEERARLVKDPANPYLLVSSSWRRSRKALLPTSVKRLVIKASQQMLGFALRPDTLRQTAGAYFADMSDHTICCAMGWSPKRAVELAYATREVHCGPRQVL